MQRNRNRQNKPEPGNEWKAHVPFADGTNMATDFRAQDVWTHMLLSAPASDAPAGAVGECLAARRGARGEKRPAQKRRGPLRGVQKSRAILHWTDMDILQRHPFPVVAWFDRVVAVTFAFPQDVLQPLVPAGLEMDTYEGLGFVAVALVWTRRLRPAGFPAFLGQDFFLAGYRVFARLRDESGRRLRGLKILRSETDQRRMVWSGNLLTKYHYRHVQVRQSDEGSITRVEISLPSGEHTLRISFDTSDRDAALPAGSPFPDWRTARQFAGPMPFTFSPEKDGKFVVIKGTRADWTPRPVAVKEWEVGLFEESPLRGTPPILANAFAVEGIAYRWERGRIVRPGGPA